jgi:hypothetical protein
VVVARLEQDRPVGIGGVEPGRVEERIGSERRVVGAADDPVELGMLDSEPANDLDDLGDRRRRTHLRTGELHPAPQRVHVPVAEAGHQHPTGEVDDLSRIRRQFRRRVVECDDAAVSDCCRPRLRCRRVAGEHRPPAEDHVDATQILSRMTTFGMPTPASTGQHACQSRGSPG